MRRRLVLWGGLLLTGVGLALIVWAWLAPRARPSIPPSPSPEPIVPTPTATEQSERLTPASEAITTATATPTTTSTPTAPSPSPSPDVANPTGEPDPGILYRGRPRWGIGVSVDPISRYDTDPFEFGWYLDWATDPNPERPHGAEYAQMVRLKGGVLQPDAEAIAGIAQANPGSLWLIGNEPDVRWQDNVEPAGYARLYQEAYSAIKRADPTARVAIGGVTQPTELRMDYLERVLAAYEEQFGARIRVDVWNVHNFVLREERGGWGVDIPPGMSNEQGALYEIDDGDDIDIFRQQIVDFRRWMAEHGYQDKPLIVSEYGILMPEEYGFSAERVVTFLTNTFDFFLMAKDPALGYPEDDYRLVQRWCWYSLNAPESGYPTGRLIDPETGEVTAVGDGWERYVERMIAEDGE